MQEDLQSREDNQFGLAEFLFNGDVGDINRGEGMMTMLGAGHVAEEEPIRDDKLKAIDRSSAGWGSVWS